jgi:FAD synthase
VLAFAAAHPGVKTGVVTFAQPPAAFSAPADFPGLIVPLEKRLDFLQKKGLDFAIVVDFSEKFATIEGEAFLRLLRERILLRFLTEGPAFRMGARGACGVGEIEKLAPVVGFTFSAASPVLYDGERISSSRIRGALARGQVGLAETLLGRSLTEVTHRGTYTQ